MADRTKIAASAAQGLEKFASKQKSVPVMVGFDGFVDSIIAVVDKRHRADRFDPMKTIDQFGKKILAAAGMSSNYELVVKLQKLGGNGPIMAMALAQSGLPVTYLGAVGAGGVHPAFEELAKVAKVIGVDNPGTTDALEFHDGKILLGKYDWLCAFDWKLMEKAIGHAALIEVFAKSKFFGIVNWTMMPGLVSIWENLIKELPAMSQGGRKLIFIDLADPEKRTTRDLRDALHLQTRLQTHADVMLGLNLKESDQAAAALGIKVEGDWESKIQSTAVAIAEKLKLHTVVIHPRKGAAAARLVNGKYESASFAGPYVAQPKLSTGAGDNFNAGFSLGTLAGLSLEACLCAGTATSGYYVRNAGSPTLQQLADFCKNLPAPQNG